MRAWGRPRSLSQGACLLICTPAVACLASLPAAGPAASAAGRPSAATSPTTAHSTASMSDVGKSVSLDGVRVKLLAAAEGAQPATIYDTVPAAEAFDTVRLEITNTGKVPYDATLECLHGHCRDRPQDLLARHFPCRCWLQGLRQWRGHEPHRALSGQVRDRLCALHRPGEGQGEYGRFLAEGALGGSAVHRLEGLSLKGADVPGIGR